MRGPGWGQSYRVKVCSASSPGRASRRLSGHMCTSEEGGGGSWQPHTRTFPLSLMPSHSWGGHKGPSSEVAQCKKGAPTLTARGGLFMP